MFFLSLGNYLYALSFEPRCLRFLRWSFKRHFTVGSFVSQVVTIQKATVLLELGHGCFQVYEYTLAIHAPSNHTNIGRSRASTFIHPVVNIIPLPVARNIPAVQSSIHRNFHDSCRNPIVWFAHMCFWMFLVCVSGTKWSVCLYACSFVYVCLLLLQF